MNVTIPIYQWREGGDLWWTTLGLGRHGIARSGHSALKIHRALVGELKKIIAGLEPSELERFQTPRGLHLEHLRLELVLRGAKKRKLSGSVPIILEPRWTTEERRMIVAYHPLSQEDWFPVHEDEALETQAAAFFQRTWAELEDEEIDRRVSAGKDVLRSVSFSARPKTLLDRLPDRPRGPFDDLLLDPSKSGKDAGGGAGAPVLPKIATNLTFAAVEGALFCGLPRSPFREQLQQLLAGQEARSTIVVGPPGSGKTTLVHRLIEDRLDADGYPTHRNLDRIHEVWRTSGKRLIAGMSYVGDWEQRALDLLQEAKRKKLILYVEDLFAFGRIGQTRTSDRSLADFLRGPVDRGELTIIGECTPEQLQRLEDDAPSFAALFARVHVRPTTSEETLRMMMAEARRLEQRFDVTFDPFAFRTILELGGSLFPSSAFPGKALDLLRELAQRVEPEELPDIDDFVRGPSPSGGLRSKDVVRTLAKKTGLPELLLEPTALLDPAEVRRELEKSVMGQRPAIEAAVDLVVRIKAGLTDPSRPFGVYLFTGPTGTGKTELAVSIAAYLYGDKARLLRFDMSEYGGPDAPARLIGDRFAPEGALTQSVLDQPFSVVVFDEIEKAHPSVLNLLLQLFDEGRLTDARGHTADFTHAVVIMTSNLGAKDRATIGFEGSPDAILFDIAREVREFFPPELFNRIDRVVPFRPLTREVARRIAEKELSRMVARRGLTGRSIFVHANEAVFDRIVREAFDPKDGARPVKRWVERKIGGLLTNELVTQAGRASLQIFRVFCAGEDGVFRLHTDRLVEAEPRALRSALEPMLDQSPGELRGQLPKELELVERLLDSRELASLGDLVQRRLAEYNVGQRAHDDVLFDLETLRLKLLEYRDEIELLLESHDGEAHELVELDQFNYEEGTATRVFDRRMMQPKVRPLVKDQILEVLAEVYFLERALGLVEDPAQHTVFIELLRIGHARRLPHARRQDELESPGLLESLAHAYLSGRGALEAWAARTSDGEVSSGTAAEIELSDAEHVVLKLRGLCVLALYGEEEGSHIARSLEGGTELVRVRVRPATLDADHRPVEPAALIEEHQKKRRAFERALERGRSELPPNPEALLPAVRSLRTEVADREGAAPLVEVEDYVLGYTTKVRARTLGEVLSRLWMLRMSTRQEVKA